MIYLLFLLIFIIYLYFGFIKRRENFIIYNNDNAKDIGIDFSNYNVFYEKKVLGAPLNGSFNVGGQMITFNSGIPTKLMTIEQLKKTAELLGDNCAGFYIKNSDADTSKSFNSMDCNWKSNNSCIFPSYTIQGGSCVSNNGNPSYSGLYTYSQDQLNNWLKELYNRDAGNRNGLSESKVVYDYWEKCKDLPQYKFLNNNNFKQPSKYDLLQSYFLKSVSELLSDPLSLEKNLSDEEKKKYNEVLTNIPQYTSFVKKFINRVNEQNKPELKDNRGLFAKNECAIIDDGKNDIMQFKGTLDECKTKCASINDCQVFNRGKDVFESNSSECILKKTYQNKLGVCVQNDKYISYSRGGQIKYEILEIKERERIERERIEKERREKEERERKERERIEKERREREERERREREEREKREREEREKREREERERNERERNMVVYNGNTYKTLADWDKNDSNATCQNSGYGGQNYIELPNGWSIAPDNQDSIQVIKSKAWRTHVLVVSNGNSYGTAIYSQGSFWNANMLRQSGNSYMPGSCHLGILLIKNK